MYAKYSSWCCSNFYIDIPPPWHIYLQIMIYILHIIIYMSLSDVLDHLSMLIRETASRRVEFIYAIAPGLDITFSNEKDLTALKNKLNQVMCKYIQ